ncbi:hypothetical protein [Streptomyces sp. C10-9-1]|uniref:hypothetical protein n=1 Tax=Streptomyces sp. C10-9-1 TaxID=1859285 RepID=UPI003F4A5594
MGVSEAFQRNLALTTPLTFENVILSSRLSLHMRTLAMVPRTQVWQVVRTLAAEGVQSAVLNADPIVGRRYRGFVIRLDANWRMVGVELPDSIILVAAVVHERWWDALHDGSVPVREHTLERLLLQAMEHTRAPAPRIASSAARRLMRAAARCAGSSRPYLHDEWTNALLGPPERESGPSLGQQRRLAAGFLLAALRMRAHDATRGLWRPVDWVLADDGRLRVSVTSVVGAQAIYIVGDGGLDALVTEIWEPCGILGGSLYLLARFLRTRRGIQIAEHDRQDPEG